MREKQGNSERKREPGTERERERERESNFLLLGFDVNFHCLCVSLHVRA